MPEQRAHHRGKRWFYPIASRHNVRGLVVIVHVVAYPPQIACSRDRVSASLGSVPFRMAHRLRMNIHMRLKLVGVHLSNLSLLQGLVVSTSFRSNAGSPPLTPATKMFSCPSNVASAMSPYGLMSKVTASASGTFAALPAASPVNTTTVVEADKTARRECAKII
jgi:hypothetical protein